MRRPCIIYHRPKSRTWHNFSPKATIPEIVKKIDHFLQNCTTAIFCEPREHRLQIGRDNLYAIKKAKEKFGDTIIEFGPNEFKFSKDRLEECIQFVKENGSVTLYTSFSFHWKNPSTNVVLPNQERESILRLSLKRASYCTPGFAFPFEKADNEFWNYIDNIIPFVPFKFNENDFKLVIRFDNEGYIKAFDKTKIKRFS